MGHHGHRGGCGCGRGGCYGGCGWGGWGYGGYPLALAAAAPYGGAFAPRFGADPVAAAPMMAPVAAAMQMAAPAQMMAPPVVAFNQAVMGGYIGARNAAGFPVMPIIGPLGFKHKKVRKHSTRTVVARPQSFYTPKSIYIPCEVAKHFEICEIRVGQICVLGGRDAIPAELYSNTGLGPAIIQLPPVIPGQHVYLRVRNHSSHSHWFRAALNGIELA